LIALFVDISPTWITASLSATLIASSLIWWQLNQLEHKFYQGKETPARNLPGKQK
jgi:hypothetical protein